MLELLLLLVENRDRMLGKDEILARVWDGRIVADSALSTAIKATRQAIGDDGRRQGMIETRHGRGFRFRAPVEALATAGAPPLTGAGTAPAVAVLLFAFAGDDPADALLADGIAEELAASLARLRWFPVIARESVAALRARGASPAEIAAEVDLACLVEGSVHRRGRDDPGQRRAGRGPEPAATGGDGASTARCPISSRCSTRRDWRSPMCETCRSAGRGTGPPRCRPRRPKRPGLGRSTPGR